MPFYFARPDDAVGSILRQLDCSVGRGNYELAAPEYLVPLDYLDDDDDDDDGDDEYDHDEDPVEDGESSEIVSGDLDWARACRDVPSEDVLEGIDLDQDAYEAVQCLVRGRLSKFEPCLPDR